VINNTLEAKTLIALALICFVAKDVFGLREVVEEQGKDLGVDKKNIDDAERFALLNGLVTAGTLLGKAGWRVTELGRHFANGVEWGMAEQERLRAAGKTEEKRTVH